MKRVLVTGAAGFLGTECVKNFRNRGFEVLTTDKVGDVDYLGDLSNITFVNTLPDVDVLLHCAAVQYVSKDLPLLFRKRYFKKNNVQVTNNLCDRYNSINVHFINIATSMMYKQVGNYIYTPHSPMLGEGVYSKSKLLAMSRVNTLANPTANVIPCIIGGHGREGLFTGFVKMLKIFGFAMFPGLGMHKVHMVHVSDVADLVGLVIEKKATGFFNAAAPEPLTISQWVDEIAVQLNLKRYSTLRIPLWIMKIISYGSLHRVIAKEQLIMLEKAHVLSIDNALSIGWKPKFNNAKIVRDIAAYINNQ